MDLTLALRPGPRVRFGEIRIEGLESVQEDAVRRRLPWQPGEVISAERLAEGRTALFDSGLFSSVMVDLGAAPDPEGRLPVMVELKERKHRSIGLGARFRTDEGLGGNLSWEHRNFFGRGERVAVELDGSFIGGHLTGSFRKPDFWRRNQSLLADTRLAYEHTDAFESTSAGASGGLERLLTRGMTIAGRVAFRAVHIQERDQEEEDFGLLSLPVLFQWDRSDDLLNPSRGGRIAVENEPFLDVLGDDLVFNRSRLTYSHYLKVLDSPGVVLAGRGSVGTLFGASRDAVPADVRFYAGGGQSVRGFGFQLAGELDEDHNPLGGRSLLELSGEIRLRLTETIGAVVFVDAGTVYGSSVPDLSDTLRVGAGPGLRYFSPIGPIRLDIGVPLNPRPSDDSFQLYVSLGQAF
jgi:translocation and assembly module TamA